MLSGHELAMDKKEEKGNNEIIFSVCLAKAIKEDATECSLSRRKAGSPHRGGADLSTFLQGDSRICGKSPQPGGPFDPELLRLDVD